MSDFDQMGLIVDWLDACRAGDLGGLLELYADDAEVECECNGTRLYRGRDEIGAFWGPKLHIFTSAGLGLEQLDPTTGGVELEYSIAGSLRVRARFGFSAKGKIDRTWCEPARQQRPDGCAC
jgi:hypothetical protein